MTAQPRRVAITQPYVPAYRFPLWDKVVSTLADQGVETRIFFGGDAAQLTLRAERGDGVEAPWAEQVAVTTVAAPHSMKMLAVDWRIEDAMSPLPTSSDAKLRSDGVGGK